MGAGVAINTAVGKRLVKNASISCLLVFIYFLKLIECFPDFLRRFGAWFHAESPLRGHRVYQGCGVPFKVKPIVELVVHDAITIHTRECPERAK